MINIGRHIEYLLLSHDCVIVPGWGAMLCEYTPARVDDDGHTIVPPSRGIIFNPGISHNDGMLASSVSRHDGMSYDAARRAIDDEVTTMRHQLKADGEVALGRLGLFTVDGGDTPVFTPGTASVVNARYNALPRLQVTPVIERARLEEDDANADIAAAAAPRRFLSAPIRAAAAVAVIAAVICAALLPGHFDMTQSHADTASMPAPTALLRGVERDSRHMAEECELTIAIPADTAAAKAPVDTMARHRYRAQLARTAMAQQTRAQKKAAAPKAVAPRRMVDSDPYVLVVSSHTSRAEADKYVARHGASALKVLEQDGKYRVYAATGSTSDEARAQRSPRWPGAWVCPRK